MFGRVQQFDERSRFFPIRTVLPDRPLRSYTWNGAPHLDQGVEGACVGHAWAHEVGAKPRPRLATSGLAFDLYRRAQQLDPWDGEDYSGTSVLAGAKATMEQGFLSEYRWAFGLQETLQSVAYKGPVVIGVDWYSNMMRPDLDGFLRPTGSVVGGHAILVKGISVPNKRVTLHNSWGPGWGRGGDAYLSFDDLGKLLADGGEACVPVVRV